MSELGIAPILVSTVNNPISGTGESTDPLSLDISATANNSLSIDGTGLYNSEHYSDDFGTASSGDSGGASIDAIGSVTVITGATITINNPSASRALSVYLSGGAAVVATLQTTGVWDAIIEQNIDSGGFASYASKRYGPYPAGGNGVAMDVYGDYVTQVAASGSKTIQRRLVVTTVVGSTSSTIGAHSIDARGLWVTN